MRNGNFNDIYQKYHRFSVNSARKIVKDEMLAEDISQEVFYHLYEIRGRLDLTNERMIKSLIFMASVNKAKDYVKKSWKQHEYCISEEENSIHFSEENTSLENMMIRKEENEYKKYVLDKLRRKNPMNYEILIKIVYFGMSPDSVAEEYDITRNNVNNRILRTRKWMKKELEKLWKL